VCVLYNSKDLQFNLKNEWCRWEKVKAKEHEWQRRRRQQQQRQPNALGSIAWGITTSETMRRICLNLC